MGRKRLLTRRQTMCVTLTVSAFDKVLELADKLQNGNMSQTVEMLINNGYYLLITTDSIKEVLENKSQDNG